MSTVSSKPTIEEITAIPDGTLVTAYFSAPYFGAQEPYSVCGILHSTHNGFRYVGDNAVALADKPVHHLTGLINTERHAS